MGTDFFVVVALGDSLTFGYRMRDPYAMDTRVPYPNQLEALLKERIREKQVLVINAGVNGDPTDGMIGRFSRVVAPEKPDVVVVWGGINDLGATRLPEHVMNNLVKLYAMCEGISAKPIACTLTPTSHTSPKTRRLNELIRAHSSEKDMALADLFPALADAEGNLSREYSDDGAHLTQAGYQKVAQIVFQAIAGKMEP